MISVDARGFRVAAFGAVGVSVVLLFATIARGRSGEAAILAAFVVAAAGLVSMRRTVPSAVSLAFALAVGYAAAGWTWDLFERIVPFDEIAHVLTGFALTPALAFLLLEPWLPSWRAHALRLSILTVTLGVSAGAAWEIAEWIVRELTARESVTHSLDDAITDMILGGFGSTASLALTYWCVGAGARARARPRADRLSRGTPRRRRRRHPAPPRVAACPAPRSDAWESHERSSRGRHGPRRACAGCPAHRPTRSRQRGPTIDPRGIVMPHSFESLPERGAWRLAGAHEGFEVARFRVERDGIVLTGTSVGIEDGVPWDLRYVIELDGSWRTRRAVVETGDGRRVEIATDGGGGWLVDGLRDPGLDGCIDLDLEGSVVTNTVPVHRLALAVAEHADAPAAYVRARTLTVERLDQTYARLADDGGVLVLDYASPRFGYRDRLRFSPDGLVLDYPNVGSRVRAPGSR